jgi:hypothetical protein
MELLKRLEPSLPDFTHDCWQSTMRRYARHHPDYATLRPWSGRETADIRYRDARGFLTAKLIEAGYLDAERWQGKTPDCWIEVKSTEDECGTPFFVSRDQYQLVS